METEVGHWDAVIDAAARGGGKVVDEAKFPWFLWNDTNTGYVHGWEEFDVKGVRRFCHASKLPAGTSRRVRGAGGLKGGSGMRCSGVVGCSLHWIRAPSRERYTQWTDGQGGPPGVSAGDQLWWVLYTYDRALPVMVSCQRVGSMVFHRSAVLPAAARRNWRSYESHASG